MMLIIDCHAPIWHFHDRRHVAMLVTLLVLGRLVGRAGQCVELAPGKCGGYADYGHVGARRDRVHDRTFLGDIGAKRLEILHAADVVFEQ